jgi:hypothetical protein
VLPFLVLPLVAFVAGFVDAIAGGGGLVTVPALLTFTPDVRLALGTNKGQAVFGSFASFVSFARAGRVNRQRAVPAFAAALGGSLLGSRLVFAVKPETLRPVVLALLVAVAVFFLVRRRRPPQSAVVGEPLPEPAPGGLAIVRANPLVFAALVGGVIGTYDGFFGPGTGTFLIALHTALFGDGLTEASANAKVANFASNLGAVGMFAWQRTIDWRWAMAMAVMQAAGGYVGARAAIKGGERVVRVGVLVVTVALCVRLAWQMLA